MISVPDDKAGGRPELKVLALNSGSSSLKFGVYRVGPSRTDMLISGEAEGIGEAKGRFHAKDSQNNSLLSEAISIPGPTGGFGQSRKAFCRPENAGTGRDRASNRAWRTKAAAALPDRWSGAACSSRRPTAFAPLHTPPALSVIRFAQQHFPGLPQAACFDTTFHADMPERAHVLPLPREFRAAGIQRYGFHGLSCESIMHQLAEAPDRLIIAHLGNGASVTAVRNGIVDRHQHGTDPDRWRDHGHAQRRSRSGRPGLSGA